MLADILPEPQQQRSHRLDDSRLLVNNKLSLSARTLQRHHHGASGTGRNFGSQIASHQVEAQIKTRGGACRRQYVSVVDIEHVWVNADCGMTPGQFLSREPMRRRLKSIKHAGSRKNECAGTNRGNAGATADSGSQRAKEFLWNGPVDVVDSGDNYGVGAFQQ
jgi:hypothetical protein